MTARLTLRLPSRIGALAEMEQAVEQFGTEQEWAPALLFQMQLALEELASNVIRHGFGTEGHEFEVVVASTPEAVTINVVDDAPPYNPLTEAPDPDVNAVLEDRQIGGLGLFLVRDVADEMQYSREDGQNRLTVVKRRD